MPNFEEVTRLVGFDFGHADTSVSRMSVAMNAEPYPVEVWQNVRVITTAVGKMPDGSVAVGNQALLRQNVTDLEAAFKGPNVADRRVRGATSAFIGAVLKQYSEDVEPIGPGTMVVFGHPSGWSPSVIDGYTRLLGQIAEPAQTIVMPESRAAFLTVVHEHGSDPELATLGERVLIVDIGSSTTDFTVAHGPQTENALGDAGNFDGVALGASLIEEFLLERCVARHRLARKIQTWFAEYPTERVRTLIEFRRRKEDFFSNERDLREDGRRILAAIALVPGREVFLEFPMAVSDFDDALNSPLDALGGVSWLERYRRDLTSVAERLDGPATRLILAGGGSRMECTLKVAKEVFPAPTDVWRAGQPEHAVSLGLARGGSIRRRADGYRQAVDGIVRSGAISAIIERVLPDVPQRYAKWYAYEAYDVVAYRVLARWRSGEIDTLRECTKRVNDELPVQLAHLQARQRLD